MGVRGKQCTARRINAEQPDIRSAQRVADLIAVWVGGPGRIVDVGASRGASTDVQAYLCCLTIGTGVTTAGIHVELRSLVALRLRPHRPGRYRLGGLCRTGTLLVGVGRGGPQVLPHVAGRWSVSVRRGPADVGVGASFGICLGPLPRRAGDAAVGVGQGGFQRRVDLGLVPVQRHLTRLIHVVDVDGHRELGRGARGVCGDYLDRIAVPGLVVQGSAGLQLAGGPDYAEVGRARVLQGVGQGVVVGVGGGHRGADVLVRGGVLVHIADAGLAGGEPGR